MERLRRFTQWDTAAAVAFVVFLLVSALFLWVAAELIKWLVWVAIAVSVMVFVWILKRWRT
jgi:flagellar biosynthesis component FlhA